MSELDLPVMVVMLYALSAIWIFFDARKRKNRFFVWSILTFIIGPFIILPFYFAYRNLKAGEVRVGGTVWHIFRNYTLSWTALVFFTVFVMMLVLDPEGGFGTFLIGGIIWFFVAFFIMLIGLFFKQSDIFERGSPDR